MNSYLYPKFLSLRRLLSKSCDQCPQPSILGYTCNNFWVNSAQIRSVFDTCYLLTVASTSDIVMKINLPTFRHIRFGPRLPEVLHFRKSWLHKWRKRWSRGFNPLNCHATKKFIPRPRVLILRYRHVIRQRQNGERLYMAKNLGISIQMPISGFHFRSDPFSKSTSGLSGYHQNVQN